MAFTLPGTGRNAAFHLDSLDKWLETDQLHRLVSLHRRQTGNDLLVRQCRQHHTSLDKFGTRFIGFRQERKTRRRGSTRIQRVSLETHHRKAACDGFERQKKGTNHGTVLVPQAVETEGQRKGAVPAVRPRRMWDGCIRDGNETLP